MIWLNPNEYRKQKYIELRLYAPQNEKIVLDFNPLKVSGEPDWNPAWEEWHCYAAPLRIYKQDYELLLDYFNKIYPTKDAFDGTMEPAFDVCSYNWIGRDDWFKVISEVEQDLENISDDKKPFFTDFLEWLRKALNYTSIIVVEGNL
ncbi:MAG: BdrN protein [Lachnospiraceae bacterium]|nr:BdrN protein [Lachnospiraceae bacterium]